MRAIEVVLRLFARASTVAKLRRRRSDGAQRRGDEAGSEERYRSSSRAAIIAAERKRLANELKTSGDKAGAARLAKLGRPTVSAWVVNQLWWHAREAFEEFFATAARLREGDLASTKAHRDALANLRTRAAAMLEHGGQSALDTTLRRVTTTLSALGAAGTFDPDPPGALAADRDAPGFEAAGIGEMLASKPPAELRGLPAANKDAEQAHKRAEDAAERKRVAEERARKQAERDRLEAAVRTQRGELEARTRELKQLREEVAAAADRVEKARSLLVELESRFAALD